MTFEVEKIDPKILVFKNAFKESKDLIEYLEKKSEEWTGWYTFGNKISLDIPTYDSKNFPSEHDWQEVILNNLQDKPLQDLCKTFFEVTRYYVESLGINLDSWVFYESDVCKYVSDAGVSENYAMNYHTDFRQSRADEPGDKFEITCVFYLNEEYDGGEISFRIFDENLSKLVTEIDYKPSWGDVIIFPSKHPYYHGVKILTSGTKYIVRTYWRYWYEGSPEIVKEKEKYSQQEWDNMMKPKDQKDWEDLQNKLQDAYKNTTNRSLY